MEGVARVENSHEIYSFHSGLCSFAEARSNTNIHLPLSYMISDNQLIVYCAISIGLTIQARNIIYWPV